MIPEVINKGLSEELFNKIVEANQTCNYHNHLGLYLTFLEYKTAGMQLQVTDCHINPRNIAHGAVAYAILDTAMGMAIRTINRNVVTIQSSLNHTHPAVLGDTLTARGEVMEYGKKIILAESVVYNQDQKLVAIARGTFYDKGVFFEEEQKNR